MTIAEALAWGRSQLLLLDRPDHEARLLLAHCLGKPVERIFAFPEEDVLPTAWEAFQRCITSRANHMPLAKIIGRKDFWKHTFFTNRFTLDPRPESEVMIEGICAHIPDRQCPLSFLELGLGTGCLLFSLLHEYPLAQGVGVDLSAEALEVARRNQHHLGLGERSLLIRGDWVTSVRQGFDVILSNPPYIPAAEIGLLGESVRHFEPRIALDGGSSGLEAYRHFAKTLPPFLNPGGVLALEVGHDQAALVQEIFAHNGWRLCRSFYDLLGVERISLFERP